MGLGCVKTAGSGLMHHYLVLRSRMSESASRFEWDLKGDYALTSVRSGWTPMTFITRVRL
jgi:hypothetical protein